MKAALDKNLLRLLTKASETENELQDLIDTINKQEVDYREQSYPELQAVLLSDTMTNEAFLGAIDKAISSWRLKNRVKAYSHESDPDLEAIKSLILNFPADNEKAASRINHFIEAAFQTGKFHTNDSKPDKSSIAFFCSILLTAAFPERFVDFRMNRWQTLAKNLGINPPKTNASYGEWIIWAGTVAQDIAQTPTFQKYWRNEHPLWAVAGLSWHLKNEKGTIKDSSDENTMTDNTFINRMESLLKKKRQIVLYGPPGTGKTYYAKVFVNRDENEMSILTEKTYLDNRIYHIISGHINRILADEKELALDTGYTFSIEWSDKWNYPKYFAEIQEGDHLFCYSWKYSGKRSRGQYVAVLRCSGKEGNTLHLTYLQPMNGPTFAEMKVDSNLRDSSIVRSSAHPTLKRLSDTEINGIVALSDNLDLSFLGIEETDISKPIEKTDLVTFHPSFGYEDFIEGLRPETDSNDTLMFRVQDGIFKQISRKACNYLLQEAGINKRWECGGGIPILNETEKNTISEAAPNYPFYLVIDEINRGDISRIFGELITLLETDKRYGGTSEIITRLPYSKQLFAIPPNLYVIGTMNTADKSIALVDIALRRRFGFIELMPDYNVLSNLLADFSGDVRDIVSLSTSLLKEINNRIRDRYDRDHQIGHSYLVPLKDAKTRDEAVEILRSAWYYEILPLLQEYFYDSPRKLHEVIGGAFVTVEGDHSFSFTDELSGEAFLGAVEDIAYPDSGTLIEEGSD